MRMAARELPLCSHPTALRLWPICDTKSSAYNVFNDPYSLLSPPITPHALTPRPDSPPLILGTSSSTRLWRNVEVAFEIWDDNRGIITSRNTDYATQLMLLSPYAIGPPCIRLSRQSPECTVYPARERRMTPCRASFGLSKATFCQYDRRITCAIDLEFACSLAAELPATLSKVYEILDFDGKATLAVDNARVVLIRQFASSDQRAVQLYLQLQHKNVVEVVEAFSSRKFHYIVMEEMTLCLHHLVRCPTYPSDRQLRSILASRGLQFLHGTNLGYGDLECKNMLLDRAGRLKLTNLEKLKALTPETEKRDTASLGEVSLYLMQKDAGPGVRDPSPWSAFLNFVASAPTARNVAELRKITRTDVGTFSVRFATLSDAAARARYLALLNLAPIYLSPHHHGVADVFGLSLQLFQQIHRVARLLSVGLLLFCTATALANDPRNAMETSEGQMGLMIIACMAVLALASLVKPFAYEVFLKIHQMSAALLAYLLLTQVLAESGFRRLPLYIYAGASGLLNVFFMCRYCHNNFAHWDRPQLICSEVAASEIHGKKWLHLKLRIRRRVQLRPGQYITLWIPGVQLFSSHPFAATMTYSKDGTTIHRGDGTTTYVKEVMMTYDKDVTTTDEKEATTTDDKDWTYLHVFIDPANGITRTLIEPLLRQKLTADKLEGQTIEARRERPQDPADQRHKISQKEFPARFALFTGPHGRSVNHRDFEVVVLVASGFGYWSLDGYLEDMLRIGRRGTRTREILLLYKGKPSLVIEHALNRRMHKDGNDTDRYMRSRMRVIVWPGDLKAGATRGGGKCSEQVTPDKRGQLDSERDTERPATKDGKTGKSRPEVGNIGRLTYLESPPILKDVVENPKGFEAEVKWTTDQDAWIHDEAKNINTLILVSAENKIVDELKQAVATSKKRLYLHVLDFTPPRLLEREGDEVSLADPDPCRSLPRRLAQWRRCNQASLLMRHASDSVAAVGDRTELPRQSHSHENSDQNSSGSCDGDGHPSDDGDCVSSHDANSESSSDSDGGSDGDPDDDYNDDGSSSDADGEDSPQQKARDGPLAFGDQFSPSRR
ncbi:hypothetical protein G3M48_005531 [Beauveria asiatica]|uniref:Protein kinase domain-containing protein n=1 Tax=Beauveria asiatica TaxID=1069075 RepID=A0AAW0RQX7_9HYPO